MARRAPVPIGQAARRLRMARRDFCCLLPFRGNPWGGDVERQEQRPVILLADDDKLTAAAWTAVLSMNGFEVVWAPDDGSAMALAHMGRPDLLLTDWDMPVIDGIELCRIFRNDPVLGSVPIILACSLSLLSADSLNLHNLFLQKPVDAVALLNAVSAFAVVVVATDMSQADGKLDEELPCARNNQSNAAVKIRLQRMTTHRTNT